MKTLLLGSEIYFDRPEIFKTDRSCVEKTCILLCAVSFPYVSGPQIPILFITKQYLFLSFFPSTIYTNPLRILFVISPYRSCFQYIPCVSNLPSPLSSFLRLRNFSCRFLILSTGNFFVPIFLPKPCLRKHRLRLNEPGIFIPGSISVGIFP